MKDNAAKTLIKDMYHKVINRETIAYIIAGLLTTTVNFISYESLYQLGLPNLTANAWAWVIAVTFAYIVNKKGVFRSKSTGILNELTKIGMFFAARLITLGVEQSGMYYFIEYLEFPRLMVKASLAVIIIILNYIFSKLYIFKKYKSNEGNESNKSEC